MESFSTTQRSGLPWMTNMATLAVVVVATLWSGAQRPAPVAAQLESAMDGTPASVRPAGSTQQPQAEPAPLRVKADLSGATLAQASLSGAGALPQGAVKTVGFKPQSN
ncbi:hypothetical protein [Aquabacterium sp. OR-4]|uniref:hypothetical protein n=1 Tax=Aquabacterium sp. OR-4 TaxID=2978127 RepID=UPI0028C61683|nr:hypothetical protein [Aquabacterium sp. OR-4]MDT7836420.1 hypothetical protein [Aquabacterium sp. OR-4]